MVDEEEHAKVCLKLERALRTLREVAAVIREEGIDGPGFVQDEILEKIREIIDL